MVLLYAVFATHPQRGEYSRPPLAPAVIAPQHRRPVERLACAVNKVIISAAELNKYFGKDTTPREMKDQIMSLLAEWKEKQPPERTAPEKKTDREK